MAHPIAASVVPGDLIFDIGANKGDKAEWFSQRGLDVVCVEPQPAMIELLQQRFAANAQVTVVGKGVGSKRGVLPMSISSQSPVLSTFAEHWKKGRFAAVEWDTKADVEIVLFDDLVQQYGVPRYCKIDVEGFEVEVLKGLSRRVGIISFEFTNEYMDDAFTVVEKLMSLGYRKFNVSLGENEAFYFEKWVPFHELVAILSASRNTKNLWGDVYAN